MAKPTSFPVLIVELDGLLARIDVVRPSNDEYMIDGASDVIYDALALALAAAKLIDFGGGNLTLLDGRVFKLAKSCDACQNAVRMFTRAGLESRFCVRCANDLATREWERTNAAP